MSYSDFPLVHDAPQPSCQVDAGATKRHAFGIFMALGCALGHHGPRSRLPWESDISQTPPRLVWTPPTLANRH